MRVGVVAAMVAATFGVLVAAGCGGTETEEIGFAPEKIREAETCRFALRVVDKDEVFRAEGAVDFVHKRGTIEYTGPDADGGGERLVVIWTGDDYYYKAGDRWTHVPASDDFESRGFELYDPARMLDALSTAADFSSVGREDVRGESTTHYRGDVRIREFMTAFDIDPEEEPVSRQETFPAEIWVDDDGLLRKVRYDTPVTPDSPAADVTFEFFDFGSAIEIELPDADDVDEFPTPTAPTSPTVTLDFERATTVEETP